MFANYESSSDIKDLLVTIRNAIDKKLEIIDIKDDFDRVNNYRIFYKADGARHAKINLFFVGI